MKTSNIFACAISASIVIVGIAAIADAAKQYNRGYNECQRHARSLGWNPNDEEDQGGFNKYMADCQRGTDAYAYAPADARRPVARTDQRRRPPNDRDRRALAQAEPKYQKYGVFGLEYCRDLAVFRAWNFNDEEDIAQANRFMQSCMSGKIAR